MKFIIDTQLPPRLASFLIQKGHHAVHTTFYPNGKFFTDEQIIRIALDEERIIVTKDHDFFEHYFMKGAPPCIIIIELGNTTNQQLITHIENQLPIILRMISENASLILVQKNAIVSY